MGRRIAVFGLLILVAVCSGGGWMAIRPPLAQFLVPGAADIRVTALRWNEWQLIYHTSGSPATWLLDVGRHLEHEGWNSPDRVGYGALSRSYMRSSSLVFCTLWEWAYLSFDPVRPHVAQIRVRRSIVIGWRQHVFDTAIPPTMNIHPAHLIIASRSSSANLPQSPNFASRRAPRSHSKR
jgi:hypothetical protein